jgi:hypothetical protein
MNTADLKFQAELFRAMAAFHAAVADERAKQVARLLDILTKLHD